MFSAQDQPDSEESGPDRWRILAVLLVAIFMSLVGVSIVNVGLPSIQQGLGASQTQIQWVLSGYALTFGVVLVAAGQAGDIFGRGFLFILGVAIFTLASVAAGFATDATTLTIARFVQGLGSGLLNPQGVGMIQQYFRGPERGRAFGMFGSVVGIAVAVGPLLGGLLIHLGGPAEGWRWIFLINVPVGLLALALAFAWFLRPLLNRQRRRTTRETLRELDPIGALLLGLAILALLLPFIEARTAASTFLWALLPVGAALLLAWTLWERRYKASGHSPMVDLAIFRVRSFSNGTTLIGLYFLGITSVWVLLALYMQEGLGHTALESGLTGLPNAVASALAANWAGRHVLRLGRDQADLQRNPLNLGDQREDHRPEAMHQVFLHRGGHQQERQQPRIDPVQHRHRPALTQQRPTAGPSHTVFLTVPRVPQQASDACEEDCSVLTSASSVVDQLQSCRCRAGARVFTGLRGRLIASPTA